MCVCVCVDTAAGCADVEAWPGSVVERFDDRLLVRCNRSLGDTWHLMCRNSRWVGNFGNCSDPGETRHRHCSRAAIDYKVVMD